MDCQADFQPVCGSDAKRYNNDCIMKARACREGKSVKKVADGSCIPGMFNFQRNFTEFSVAIHKMITDKLVYDLFLFYSYMKLT